VWNLAIPIWELCARGLWWVYGFCWCDADLTGKRQVGQLAPFGLVLLLVLSNRRPELR